MSIRITTLIENIRGEHLGLECEHGISFYIKTDDTAVLFDTGKSNKFIKNAEELGIDLTKVEHVVLSHGHYDHTGGFKYLVEKIGNSFDFHISKDFFDKKYGFNGLAYQFLGSNFDKRYLRKNDINTEYVTDDMVEISKGIYLFSNFKQVYEYEKINPRFYKENNNKLVVDRFEDEIVVAIETNKGLLVILGCSHPGVVNILEAIINRTGKTIYGIVGGTHLVEADNQRIVHTLEYFEEKKIKLLGICHCTGERAIKELKKFKEQFFYNSTGTSIIIDE
ncbi:MBL fold metallo-hydrolase [Crassaminicella profunda]|uniref:MBL fold metallo-hydrolase n=1 Tax=Crassaminicella profunda TaxID=1286698 RepID=UPI001CA67981|nr:MBL fold metallo-hydrolase [Crassaminicella profunda]QZY54429.1 MBL fold metallo-hydrolase [Crassaminicella profunda]